MWLQSNALFVKPLTVWIHRKINHKTERIEKLTTILHDIDTLKNLYAGTLLKSRIGSDSTGHSPKVPGMGLVSSRHFLIEAKKKF
jgi:hypothetical protein